MPDEQQGQEANSEATTEEFNFDAWLGEQPEQVRTGINSHTAGLKSALEAERQQRKTFANQLKELTPRAEKGSELERALNETSSRLEQIERQLDFVREAGKSEIGCTNPDLAYLVAQSKDLFRSTGAPDWTAIKEAAPELFGRKVTPPGNAGSGNSSPPAQPGGMNEWIRQTARGG
jgi:hypothetical protein